MRIDCLEVATLLGFPSESASQSPFKIVMNSLVKTVCSRFSGVRGLMPALSANEGDGNEIQTVSTCQIRDDQEYFQRTVSDYAHMMAELHPDKEEDIFGPDTDADRNLFYNADLVLELMMDMFFWFQEKIEEQ